MASGIVSTIRKLRGMRPTRQKVQLAPCHKPPSTIVMKIFEFIRLLLTRLPPSGCTSNRATTLRIICQRRQKSRKPNALIRGRRSFWGCETQTCSQAHGHVGYPLKSK